MNGWHTRLFYQFGSDTRPARDWQSVARTHYRAISQTALCIVALSPEGAMAYWRMKLRDGFNNRGGKDLWPECKQNKIAAITYEGITNTDLSSYLRTDQPEGWEEMSGAASKGCIRKFAWDIQGGDAIYVADSKTKQIVGMGYASTGLGKRAYRFDESSPIVSEGGVRWCHLIDVDWDETFVPFHYEKPRAAMLTVLDLKPDEVQEFERVSRRNEIENSRIGGAKQPLNDEAYPRYTPAAIRMILRCHVALSNDFSQWLITTYGIDAIQEVKQIDMSFVSGGTKCLVEFKIAYQGNTKRAIREALGQILEYNHYPPRVSHDAWLLILDVPPNEDDKHFLDSLRGLFHLPLTLGWRDRGGFRFERPITSL